MSEEIQGTSLKVGRQCLPSVSLEIRDVLQLTEITYPEVQCSSLNDNHITQLMNHASKEKKKVPDEFTSCLYLCNIMQLVHIVDNKYFYDKNISVHLLCLIPGT